MNILYATDGSDGAITAGHLLASLPLPADARVTVLSAVSSNDWVESTIFNDTSVQEVRLVQRHAEEAAALLGPRSPPVIRRIGCGDAGTAILEQAEVDHDDLIVVGSHGRGAIGRLLLGSVSEHVARYAHTSVLVARGERVERVVVGIDGSKSSEHALDALAHLPLPAEIRVTVVYVAPLDDKPLPSYPGFYPEYEQLAREYRAERRAVAEGIVCHARERISAAGWPVEVEIRWGDPADQLIAAARVAKADMLVVGSADRSGLGRLFLGSVSGHVLAHAPCSVLIARPAVIEASATAPEKEPEEGHRVPVNA